jgi:hypothetical protein
MGCWDMGAEVDAKHKRISYLLIYHIHTRNNLIDLGGIPPTTTCLTILILPIACLIIYGRNRAGDLLYAIWHPTSHR